MKILMLLDHEFPPDIRVENEIEVLHEKGHEVHLACYSFKHTDEVEKTAKATIHRKKISSLIYKSSVGALKFPFYFNFWRSFISNLFSKTTFNAIHVHDLPLAKVGHEFSTKHNVPLILDLHENWPALLDISDYTKSFLGRLLSSANQWQNYELEYCQKADQIITVVYEAKQRLVKSGIDPEKIQIVSNTLNLNHFEIPQTKPEDNYFSMLYAGGITKHRGLQYIIKGLKLIQSNKIKIRLWILGDGSYLSELKLLTKNEGVEDLVFFTGWKSYAEMQEYFGKADVCLIPHVKSAHTDSTVPHKLFQYMYAGKPVVASNCIPIERIVLESNSGLIYKYDEPEDFTEKITKLINDKHLYDQLSKNGKQSVTLKYNWEADADRLSEIYNK